MPFDDESRLVELVPWRSEWDEEFRVLAERLAGCLAERPLAIDHVGSTAVPGLPAKDVIDVQVRVAALNEAALTSAFADLGFRARPEPWNRHESIGGSELPKLVFAPPPGGRPANVHVRVATAPTMRYALLFRDYLRADGAARDGWAAFKQAVESVTHDLGEYGRIKSAAMPLLMASAERWAAETAWAPSDAGDVDFSSAGS
jgi:dephospho-CoA kinase